MAPDVGIDRDVQVIPILGFVGEMMGFERFPIALDIVGNGCISGPPLGREPGPARARPASALARGKSQPLQIVTPLGTGHQGSFA